MTHSLFLVFQESKSARHPDGFANHLFILSFSLLAAISAASDADVAALHAATPFTY